VVLEESEINTRLIQGEVPEEFEEFLIQGIFSD